MNIGKNVIWGLLDNVIRMVILFFVNVLIARHLGPSNYGALSSAYIIYNWASVIVVLGIDSVVIRELSSKNADVAKILGSAFRLRGISMIVVLAVILSLASYKEPEVWSFSSNMWSAVLVLSIHILFQPYAFGVGNQLVAEMRADILMIGKTSGLVIGTVARLVGVFSGFSMIYFAACHVLEYVTSTVLVGLGFNKKCGKNQRTWKTDSTILKSLVSDGKWTFCSAIAIALTSGAAILLLKSMTSSLETGIYAGAFRIALILQFIPSVICKSFLPVIANLHDSSDKIELGGLEKELFRLLWLFGYSAALFFLVAGDWIVPFILGEEYRASSTPLKILAVMLIPLSVGAARTVYFAKDRAYKKLLVADVSGAALTVILGFLLIPRYGANGAALASLVAASIGYIVVPYLIIERGKKSSKEVLKAAAFPFPNFKILIQAKLSS